MTTDGGRIAAEAHCNMGLALQEAGRSAGGTTNHKPQSVLKYDPIKWGADSHNNNANIFWEVV